MKLRLKRHLAAAYPVCGFFIEGSDLTNWIAAIDALGLNPARYEVYGLPGKTANSVWGCLVLTTAELNVSRLGPLASAHRVNPQLIVPAKAQVVPEPTAYDLERLFSGGTYVLHPEFGLYRLTDPVRLSDHFAPGVIRTLNALRPATYTVASGEIAAFSVVASPPEEVQRSLEAAIPREKLPHQPLTLAEKMRLKLYESVLGKDRKGKGVSGVTDRLQRLAGRLGLTGEDAFQRIQEDFDDLRERNKKEVDKLLDLLQRNPEAALRYAIPLDEHGVGRGGSTGRFTLLDRGIDLALFGGMGGGMGPSIDLGVDFYRLQQQYREAAQNLERAGKYEKAAYIYLKLLKDHRSAAASLKKGRLYEKAAVAYLHYLKDETAAAECYELGKLYGEAITLYTKLEKWEKVGDLNVLRGNPASATDAYQRQLEVYLGKTAYLKAASLCKNKLQDLPQTQTILLRGWDENVDAYNCLRTYLNNLPDDQSAWREIERIARQQLEDRNHGAFIKLLKHEYVRQTERKEEVRDLAYTLLSRFISAGKLSANLLLDFNDNNARLSADTLRFDVSKSKR